MERDKYIKQTKGEITGITDLLLSAYISSGGAVTWNMIVEAMKSGNNEVVDLLLSVFVE